MSLQRHTECVFIVSIDRCEVLKCVDPVDIIYYGHDVCDKHWTKHCDETKKFDLKKTFKIKEKGEPR